VLPVKDFDLQHVQVAGIGRSSVGVRLERCK
jgi:hypothetical protein